jgi:PhnB protein
MAVAPYIFFNGNCKEAVEFYASIFNTKDYSIMQYDEMPPSPDFPINKESEKLVMHANINLFNSMLMFSDMLPGSEFKKGNNIGVFVSHNDKAELKRIFELLQVGGKVIMPLEPTFFSDLFGRLVDKFGIDWQIGFDKDA